jgi:hypothetical protein
VAASIDVDARTEIMIARPTVSPTVPDNIPTPTFVTKNPPSHAEGMIALFVQIFASESNFIQG